MGTLLNCLQNSLKHLSRLREATTYGKKGDLEFESYSRTRVLAFMDIRDLGNERGITPLTALLYLLSNHSPSQEIRLDEQQ